MHEFWTTLRRRWKEWMCNKLCNNGEWDLNIFRWLHGVGYRVRSTRKSYFFFDYHRHGRAIDVGTGHTTLNLNLCLVGMNSLNSNTIMKRCVLNCTTSTVRNQAHDMRLWNEIAGKCARTGSEVVNAFVTSDICMPFVELTKFKNDVTNIVIKSRWEYIHRSRILWPIICQKRPDEPLTFAQWFYIIFCFWK